MDLFELIDNDNVHELILKSNRKTFEKDYFFQ